MICLNAFTLTINPQMINLQLVSTWIATNIMTTDELDAHEHNGSEHLTVYDVATARKVHRLHQQNISMDINPLTRLLRHVYHPGFDLQRCE